MSTLLLVDPDPLTLRVLDVGLRKAGFQVMMACDAAEALTKARGNVPDLLVTATRMPGVNGFALARSLRELAPDLPALFLAGPDASDAGARARDLDFDDMLPRPVFVRELVARVNLLLARRVQRAVASDVSHGSTADLALADLLQSLEASHLTGIVHLAQDGDEARIYVREGNVVDAELGRMRGADVVVRTLSWDRATFRVEPAPVDNLDLIECTTHALLLRAMDRIDDRTPAPTVVAQHEERAPVGREASPSTAPWTRETSSEDAPDADVLAAGLPKRDARAIRRVVVVGASVAAALGVWALLGSTHSRAGHAAAAHVTEATGEPPAAVVVNEALPPAPPPTVVPVPTTDAPSLPTEPIVRDAPSPASIGDVVAAAPALASPSSSAATGDPHERALDVKTVLHARSPLVRDAERALLRGDTDKALALAQKAVDASPVDADAWLTLAAAKKASGDMPGARAAYQQCIAKASTFGVMNCRVLAARSE
ncbi:MAG TPA: response regulator [Polyangiaceae bacterium]